LYLGLQLGPLKTLGKQGFPQEKNTHTIIHIIENQSGQKVSFGRHARPYMERGKEASVIDLVRS